MPHHKPLRKRPSITALSMLVKNLNSFVKPATSSSAINVLLKVVSTMYDHNSDYLDEAFDKYKGEIMPSLEPMEKQLKTIHTALAITVRLTI